MDAEPTFEPIDIRDIPDSELDDLFGGRSVATAAVKKP
jgi:hypothetical protein